MVARESLLLNIIETINNAIDMFEMRNTMSKNFHRIDQIGKYFREMM